MHCTGLVGGFFYFQCFLQLTRALGLLLPSRSHSSMARPAVKFNSWADRSSPIRLTRPALVIHSTFKNIDVCHRWNRSDSTHQLTWSKFSRTLYSSVTSIRNPFRRCPNLHNLRQCGKSNKIPIWLRPSSTKRNLNIEGWCKICWSCAV